MIQHTDTEEASVSGSDVAETSSDLTKAEQGLETGERPSSDDCKERPTTIRFDDEPSIRSIPRSRSLSLDNLKYESGTDDSFKYSFRMNHPTNDAVSDGALSATEYNFVLDNYIEYNDDTKIPRLRGMGRNSRLLEAIHESHWAVLIAVVTSSCFMTYSLSNHSPFLRADLSQAIVITTVLATFPEVAASSGAGAFVGMVGADVIPNYAWLALLSLVTSCVWVVFYNYKILVGVGGRLGTCAFISMNLTTIVFLMPSRTIPWSLYGDTNQLWPERLEILPSVLTVIASTFLSAAGGAARLKSAIPLNPVAPPTTIALLCMLILEPTGFRYTDQVDAGFAVGSFVAMASYQYLSSVLDFAGAGFTAGLWILLLDPFFLNFGGKKGFTSFCGFATYVAISRLLLRRTEKDK